MPTKEDYKMVWTVLLIAFSVSVPAFAADGKQLLDACNDYVRYASGSNPNVPAESHFSVAWCMGFVTGAEQMARDLTEARAIPRIFCKPNNVTTGQVILVVSKFLNEHPETLHQNATGHVIRAMQEAFPCKTE